MFDHHFKLPSGNQTWLAGKPSNHGSCLIAGKIDYDLGKLKEITDLTRGFWYKSLKIH